MDFLSAPRRSAPPSWVARLAQARADVTAGRTDDFETVMQALEAEDAQLEAQEPEPGHTPRL